MAPTMNHTINHEISVSFGRALARTIINALVFLGSSAVKVLLFLLLSLAKLIGGFFFILIFILVLCPSWFWSFMRAKPNAEELSSSSNTRDDAPEGWVRVDICGTDEISTLDLEAAVGAFEVGEAWDDRKPAAVSKARISEKVLRWMSAFPTHMEEGL